MKPTIKLIRIDLGMTQAQMAKKLDVSPSTLSGWEKGRSEISARALIKIAKMYGIKAEEIKI